MKENQRLEWKETWRDEFIRWICGFANADGGVLHIGRNDRGTVVGVPDAGAPKPKLILDGTGIALEFRYTPEYLKAVNALDPVTPEVTDPVTDPVKRVLLLLAQGELAPSAIQKAIGLSHRPTFRQNYLRAAENTGLIERTLPDKPNSRLQKYRLTA